jgi:hypothetical protein
MAFIFIFFFDVAFVLHAAKGGVSRRFKSVGMLGTSYNGQSAHHAWGSEPPLRFESMVLVFASESICRGPCNSKAGGICCEWSLSRDG